MQVLKGYIIIDELNKVVIGYVKDDEKVKYIAYDKTESCSISIITLCFV